MLSCGVYAYPTHFEEISNITAMRSQALGCVPCVIDYAATSETVQHGVKVKGDIYEPETKEKYAKELIKLLRGKKKQSEIREKMVPWAKKQFSWYRPAKQWSDKFKEVVK